MVSLFYSLSQSCGGIFRLSNSFGFLINLCISLTIKVVFGLTDHFWEIQFVLVKIFNQFLQILVVSTITCWICLVSRVLVLLIVYIFIKHHVGRVIEEIWLIHSLTVFLIVIVLKFLSLLLLNTHHSSILRSAIILLMRRIELCTSWSGLLAQSLIAFGRLGSAGAFSTGLRPVLLIWRLGPLAPLRHLHLPRVVVTSRRVRTMTSWLEQLVIAVQEAEQKRIRLQVDLAWVSTIKTLDHVAHVPDHPTCSLLLLLRTHHSRL